MRTSYAEMPGLQKTVLQQLEALVASAVVGGKNERETKSAPQSYLGARHTAASTAVAELFVADVTYDAEFRLSPVQASTRTKGSMIQNSNNCQPCEMQALTSQ